MADDLLEIAINDLPPGFLREVLKGLEWVYKEAKERVDNDPGLPNPEGRYLRPHFRYALCNAMIRKAADNAQLEDSVEMNVAKNHEYTLIKSGRLALTASYVDSGQRIPRPSKFRTQHAEINQCLRQMPLFPKKPSVFRPASIYGILLHGPDDIDNSLPGFLRLGFPDARCRTWVDTPIDIHDIVETQIRRYRKPEADLQALIQSVMPNWKRRFNEEGKEG